MAREIKYYNGSTNSAGTIYTVPAGRTAKVTFNYLYTESGATLYVDGHAVLSGTSGGMTYGAANISPLYTSTSNTASAFIPLSVNQGYAVDSGSNSWRILTIVWYIGAGSTITTNNTFSSTVSYSFNAIEEY